MAKRLKLPSIVSSLIFILPTVPAQASMIAGWQPKAPGVEWGGAGGGPNSKTCPSGFVAVGVTSSPFSSGLKYLYGFGFVCQKIKVTRVGNLDSLGYEFSLSGAKTDIAMVDTFGLFAQNRSLCDSGQALVGVQLDSSNGTQEFIQDVAAICEDFPSFGNQSVEAPTVGDDSDNLITICGKGFVTGFSGRTGEGLDKLGVTCSLFVPVSGPAQSPEPLSLLVVNQRAFQKLDSKLTVSVKDLLQNPNKNSSDSEFLPQALYFVFGTGGLTEIKRWGQPVLPPWLVSNSMLAEVEVSSEPNGTITFSPYESCKLLLVKGNQTMEIDCP